MTTDPNVAAYRLRRIQADECLWGKTHPGPLRPSGLCETCHQKNLKRVQQRQSTWLLAGIDVVAGFAAEEAKREKDAPALPLAKGEPKQKELAIKAAQKAWWAKLKAKKK